MNAVKTTLLIEQGITEGTKPLRDHLEAADHYEAIRYVRTSARQVAPLTEAAIRSLHRLVVLRSRPDIAGSNAGQGRYILTDTRRHDFHSPAEVPSLMGDFGAWLKGAADTHATAFAAHRRLVDIHPFNEGGSMTAGVKNSALTRWRGSGCDRQQD